MAGDWIKMRSELQTHPKVVRILSAMRPHDVQTKTDKFRVIGGLHAVWSVFDTHSGDGVLIGYTPELLDHVIGWEGLSEALISVDWLHFDGEQTLMLPEFDEHNGQSAKRRAEDQKRKRDARKSPQSVRNLSVDGVDKKRTREREDKREDIKEEKTTRVTALSSSDLVAEGIERQAAEEFIALRAKKRAPLTPGAWKGIKAEVAKAGWTLQDAVAKCLARGWQGFEAVWVQSDVKPQAQASPPLHTLTNDALEAEARRVGANTMGCNREAVIDRIRAKMRTTEEGRA